MRGVFSFKNNHMRKTGFIFCIVLASTCWAQIDSASTMSILQRLSNLEKMKSNNDTLSSLRLVTDTAYAIAAQPMEKELEILDSNIQDSSNQNQPIIAFEQESFDLGNITQGEIIKRKFIFKNAGKVKLYVTQIEVGCGCTEPEWTQEAIAPGESGYIILTYDSKEDIGKIEKYATVVHNGEGYSYLELTGFVAPKL